MAAVLGATVAVADSGAESDSVVLDVTTCHNPDAAGHRWGGGPVYGTVVDNEGRHVYEVRGIDLVSDLPGALERWQQTALLLWSSVKVRVETKPASAPAEVCLNSARGNVLAFMFGGVSLLSWPPSNLPHKFHQIDTGVVELTLSPFSTEYVGVKGSASVQCGVDDFMYRYPICMAIGLFLVLNAHRLARSGYMYYGTGVPLITAFSVFLLLFFTVNKVSGNRQGAGAAALVAMAASTWGGLWAHVQYWLLEYTWTAVGLIGGIALLAFVLLYMKGPPEGDRVLNVFSAALILVGLGFVYMGTSSTEVSLALLPLAPLITKSVRPTLYWALRLTVFAVKMVFWVLTCCSFRRPVNDAVLEAPAFARRITAEEYESEAALSTSAELHALRQQAREGWRDVAPRVSRGSGKKLYGFVYHDEDDVGHTPLAERMNTPIRIGPNGERYDPDEVGDSDLDDMYSDDDGSGASADGRAARALDYDEEVSD